MKLLPSFVFAGLCFLHNKRPFCVDLKRETTGNGKPAEAVRAFCNFTGNRFPWQKTYPHAK